MGNESGMGISYMKLHFNDVYFTILHKDKQNIVVSCSVIIQQNGNSLHKNAIDSWQYRHFDLLVKDSQIETLLNDWLDNTSR